MFGIDLPELIKTIGYIGVFAIVFAESGLLIGFFLPGDSLLFTAGFLASQDILSLPVLAIGCGIFAILGDSVGYMFGRRVGRRLFEREDSTLFKKKHLQAAEAFYEKHGGKTIIIARFIPIVRTFAPVVAGAADMTYKKFATYNIIGGILWITSTTFLGYILGNTIPNITSYLHYIIGAVIILSILPPIIEILKERKKRRLLREAAQSTQQ